jgi:REP element-mobilizing transposase RayT
VSRPLRVEYPGALYHLTARGNARQRIFTDPIDRERFLHTLTRVTARYRWLCHAYCLMTNHYHLLVETPDPNLALGMRQLNGVYARTFHTRHKRQGHLFGGRYHAVLIEKEHHLLEVARYIVLNPVRARLCPHPADWPWSSYRATAGLDPPPAFLTTSWILQQLASEPTRARERYRTLVHATTGANPLENARGGLYLGDTAFIDRAAAHARPDREHPRRTRMPRRPGLDEILSTQAPDAIRIAYGHGYRLREIADQLGVHPSTVSRRLRHLEAN